jgi:putative aminopeptidase FrvX
MEQNLNFLKEILSIPSKTYQEERMVAYIANWMVDNNIEYEIDINNNIYATKKSGDIPKDFYFPCVISHTDTVHNIDTINVCEEHLKNAQGETKLSLKAYNDRGLPTGIGGDDKCGVFACLTLLKELPYLKAAFFVSEETGCHGSKRALPEFFENVGYVIQFDAPENWMVSEECSGTVLFNRESEFFDKCNQALMESPTAKSVRYMVHPYTDVYALKNLFDFSCINISIGYYNYHTANEYVVVEDVYNGIETGKKMINLLGYNLHYKIAKNKIHKQLLS